MEGLQGAAVFAVDRSKPFVVESAVNGTKFYRIPGRFSVCNEINGNNRRYGNKVWENNLAEGSPLQESIARNAAFGLLEHPKDGQVSLLSPISHLVTEAKMDAAGVVTGELTIIETQEGTKLKALIDAGYDPLVSSRGFGTLIKASDGVDDVQEDFVCEGWDVVIKPSFSSCATAPSRETSHAESLEKKPSGEAALIEAAPVAAAPASPLPPAPANEDAVKPTTKPITERNTMNINEISTGVNALRGLSVKGQTPIAFAESIGQAETLHQSIAEWQAENPTGSYQAQKLHKQIDTITETWEASQKAPGRQVIKMVEENKKLLQIIKTLTENLLATRKALKESGEGDAKHTALVEEVAKNGTGWKARAESLNAALAEMTHKRDVSCEALDVMAKRYHEDMTTTGRRVVELEFAEGVRDPQIRAALTEATMPRQIIAIREKLEVGKSDSKDDDSCTECDESPCCCKGEKTNESQQTPVNITEAKLESSKAEIQKLAEAANLKTGVRIETNNRNPRSLSEASQIARRMSTRLDG